MLHIKWSSKTDVREFIERIYNNLTKIFISPNFS